MLLEGPGGKRAAAVARAEPAGGSPQECEPRWGAPRPGLLLGSLPASETVAVRTREELPWSRGGSPGRCGPRDPAAGNWSPPLQRQSHPRIQQPPQIWRTDTGYEILFTELNSYYTSKWALVFLPWFRNFTLLIHMELGKEIVQF